MAKLLLLVVLVLGALCVEGWSHKGKEKLKTERKWKRDNNVLGELLQEELENWRKEMPEEELMEVTVAYDSDDSDDSDEADESPEGDEDEYESSGLPPVVPPLTVPPVVLPPASPPAVSGVAIPPGVAECGRPAVMPSVNVRVVGGVEAMPHSWPWQVSLQTSSRGHFCGGSIINEQWIVSAAHCAPGFSPSSTNEVVVGMHNIRDPDEYTERVRITEIIPNAKYGRPPRDSSNDIMLLKLERPLTFNDAVSPVCLPSQFKPVASGTRCFSTGWGALHSGGRGPDELNQVMLPIIDRDVCNQPNWYDGDIDDSMVCAGYAQGGRDTCQGDSGGPLVCFEDGRWMLYGVVSWGRGCAQARYPGLYARVSPYIKWMNEMISEYS